MTRDARTGTDDVPPTPQPALPFDDGADQPIAFALTARARRTVAPDDLPSLRVVERRGTARGHPEPDERSDTRPARARALARAGVPLATVARQLDVDELLVRAWTGAVPTGTLAPPADHAPRGDTVRTAYELARAAAADEVAPRLATDARLAAGLGLLAGIATVDPHAVTVSTADAAVARTAVRWLLGHADVDPARLRIILRVAAGAAGDLVRHRWARDLGVAGEQVVITRWPGAPSPDAVEALVRVADPVVAATFAGWRDALLVGAAGVAETDEDF